jgi:ribonuclease HI
MAANSLKLFKESITIFTDGSCHTQSKVGGWASILFIESKKIILEGNAFETTHQRMELTAVLESLKYLVNRHKIQEQIFVYSDSQYVVDLLQRKERLMLSHYRTKKLKPIRNTDLVQELIGFMAYKNIRFLKIKSHQSLSNLESVLNREVDVLSRKNMRSMG